MERVIARELTLIGSHGMAGHRFPRLFGMIEAGRLDPAQLVSHRTDLEGGARLLMGMGDSAGVDEPTCAGDGGIAVIDRF